MTSVTTLLDVASVPAWTDTADVVVVGYGAAGAAAACEAAEAGATVLVAERAGAGGGAAALSDGMVYLGGGTATQRAAGVEDSPAAMRTFLLAAGGPEPDEAKIDVYVDRSVEHHDWLVGRGVEFLGRVHPDSIGPSARRGEGLMFTGGENAAPFSSVAPPAQRAHVTQGGRTGGKHLVAALIAAAEAAGARPLHDTRARRLVVDDGRVVGVECTRFGETVWLRATGGVVLTAGGFAFNDEMLRRFAPEALRASERIGTPGDDGSGIVMAQAAGARVKRMDSLEWAFPFNLAPENVHGILVDELGRRFVNEDTYMGRVGQHAMHRQSVHLIVDEAHYRDDVFGRPADHVAGSVEELEVEIGLPAGSLTSTLEHYNAHAAHGSDPVFGKASRWLTPLTGSLAAFDLSPGRFHHAMFTLGGLDTTPAGEVVSLDGEPIAGLFAAGRTTSGVAARGYCSGLSLGDGSLFGRLAARSALISAPTKE